ncbi:ATP-binding protein [Denitrificimonas caeni]|uniref:ATP-binding protein n=1 Tax=Denitrificimonas caeni TaxID=521720 RepID=UPI00196687C4|nr:ATP-binding protein [Denitrificimonas caeni]
MSSIFFRIYGGLLAALILTAGFGALALHLTHEIRADQHRERLASGTFRLMAANLEALDTIERKRATALWGRLLGVPLTIKSIESLTFDRGDLRHLLRGRVLVKHSDTTPAKVYSLINTSERKVLVGEVRRVSEQLARATVYLLVDELVRYPAAEQAAKLAELAEQHQFGFALSLLSVDKTDLDADQLRRIEEGDTVMALDQGGDAIRVFAGVNETPWVLMLGPVRQLNAYPAYLLLLIAALGLSMVGILVYLLVRHLERRLQDLEYAASRIAQGHLNVQVAEGSSDSVGRLALRFNEMAARLKILINVQGDMVRAVAHELRTPLARLRFALDMAAHVDESQVRSKYFDGMDQDIEDMDGLLNEMLTYARLEAGMPSINFSRVELHTLIEQVIQELAPLRPEIALQYEKDGASECWVDAEGRYLHQALQNLVSNAQRYARHSVSIVCRVQHELCYIAVEDDGVGIAEALREKVFTPFFRLDDSRTRASGGHGLGLAIVKRIMYLHSGRVRIESSRMLGGARIVLVWPQYAQVKDARIQ